MDVTASKAGLAAWEQANGVTLMSADEIYAYDSEKYKLSLEGAPWKKDPHHFKKAIHARSGGPIEVMGVMQGRVDKDTFIIMDSFALPVEATEVRVNAGAEAYEYMAQFLSLGEAVSRPDNLVGWYHSHPGYGCWLSGIDVNTQMQNQTFQDPWLAIVVDPVRTISSGQVQIGAFRTYPKDYTPPDSASEYQTIPLEKIEDFGVHCKSYYQLDISVFKSSLDSKLLDLLWNKYWVSTLSTSPTITNRDFASKQLLDLCSKLEQVESTLVQSSRIPGDKKESQLSKLSKDCCKASVEQVNGIMTQVIKHALFNAPPATASK